MARKRVFRRRRVERSDQEAGICSIHSTSVGIPLEFSCSLGVGQVVLRSAGILSLSEPAYISDFEVLLVSP